MAECISSGSHHLNSILESSINFQSNNANEGENHHDDPDSHSKGQRLPRTRNKPGAKQLRDRLYRELRHFFMNPIDKWKTTKNFPWKLTLQLTKLIIVTLHITTIGYDLSTFTLQRAQMASSLRRALLKDWDPIRESMTYPPAIGPFGIYTKDHLYEKLDHTIKGLSTITQVNFEQFAYDGDEPTKVPPINITLINHARAILDPFNYRYDFDGRETRETLILNPGYEANDSRWENFSFRGFLREHDREIDFNRWKEIHFETHLRTIYLNALSLFSRPECYLVHVMVRFLNGQSHSGQITVSCETNCFHTHCNGDLQVVSEERYQIKQIVTVLVLIMCFSSWLLCIRSILLAWRLQAEVDGFLSRYCNKRLSMNDRWAFIDFSLLTIALNDTILVILSAIKLSEIIGWSEQLTPNDYSLLYGICALLTWVSLLRYISHFERFNTILLTVQKVTPDIFKLMLCGAIIFIGFALSGWIVLGPYHLKFRTLSLTVECLFALVNADDMFATFASLDTDNIYIWWFSRIYLYSFVCLFIYAVLNLMLAIVVEASEIVKRPQESEHRMAHLQKLISENHGRDSRATSTSNHRESIESSLSSSRLYI